MAKHRATAAKKERVGPAPETAAKLRPDAMHWLLAAHPKLFAPEHDDAAREIERAHRLLAAPVALRVQDLSRAGHAQPREWTDREAELIGVYCNWQDEIALRRIPFWSVYDVVIEGLLPAEAAAMRGADPTAALHWLAEALEAYARMRGWRK